VGGVTETESVSEALRLQRETEAAILAAVNATLINPIEAGAAAGLAAKVKSGRGLTADEARRAWRILQRNASRLDGTGIALPGSVPVQAKPVHDTPDNPQPVLAMRPDGRIGITGSLYAIRETLKTVLHASWDKAAKQWSVPASPAYAAGALAVLESYHPAVSARVRELADEHMHREAARAVLDPSNPVPELDLRRIATPGARAWEHQARGVEYASSASSCLLAVPMGGGKTAMSVWTANRVGTKRAIIVCPNKVRGVWPREVRKWSSHAWHIVDGKRPAKRKGAKPQDLTVPERVAQAEECLFDCQCGAEVHAAVWNYEMLSHPFVAGQGADGFWKPAHPLDLVIYDEIHRLKSATGITSKTAARWITFTERRLGLTGTPMPQRPTDIFGLYRALDPGLFGEVWTAFKNEYALERTTKDGRSFIVGIQPHKKAEFAAKVHSIMYRPTVDLKLPGRSHVTIPVELEPAAQRAYRDLDTEMWADLRAFKAGEADADTISPRNILSCTMRLAQLTGGTLPNDEYVVTKGKAGELIRVSEAKAKVLAEILEDVGCVPGHHPEPEPVVVYCQFTQDLAAVRQVAEKAGLRYGEVSGRRSDGLTDASEMSPDCDVVGVQIQSGGTGVDLTRSCVGVWYSVGYSLGDYDQARHRQDRPGQTRPVRFFHLLVPDSIDEQIYEALSSRRSVVMEVLKREGIDPNQLGLFGVAEPDPDEDEMGPRTGGAVALPIDEWGGDVMAPRERPRRAGAGGLNVPDADTLAEYGLEDFF
jgi:hypothetical protein